MQYFKRLGHVIRLYILFVILLLPASFIALAQDGVKRELTVHTALPQSINSTTAPELPVVLPNVGRLMMVAFEQSDTETQTILEAFQPGGFAFFPGDIVST